MKITSPALAEGQPVPSKYTCDGEDMLPPLTFEEVPSSAATLALVMDDPDAPGGTWDHWIIWNMPPDQLSVGEGTMPEGVLGRNSWGKNGWGGPCPPDRRHRYIFRLYALDAHLPLPSGATKADLEQAMKNHVIATAQLTCVYDRVSRTGRK